jgi:hypothetical protein
LLLCVMRIAQRIQTQEFLVDPARRPAIECDQEANSFSVGINGMRDAGRGDGRAGRPLVM